MGLLIALVACTMCGGCKGTAVEAPPSEVVQRAVDTEGLAVMLAHVLRVEAVKCGITSELADQEAFLGSVVARYAHARTALLGLMNKITEQLEAGKLTLDEANDRWLRLEAQCAILGSMQDLFIRGCDQPDQEALQSMRDEYRNIASVHLFCRHLHRLYGGKITPAWIRFWEPVAATSPEERAVFSLSVPVLIPLPIDALTTLLRAREEGGEPVYEDPQDHELFWEYLRHLREDCQQGPLPPALCVELK
jgi:hypothetical protein